MANLKTDVTDLRTDSKEIKETVYRLEQKQDLIYLQTGKLSEYHSDVTSRLVNIEDRLAFQTHKLTETELELFKLKRD